MCLISSSFAVDVTCASGTAPPMTSVNPVVYTTGSYQSVPVDKRVELRCDWGYLVCGFGIFRLSSVFTGNINIIRDVTLRCCSLSGASNYVTKSMNHNNTNGYYDSLYSGYYETVFHVLYDIKRVSFSQQGFSLAGGGSGIQPSVFGTDTSTSMETCPFDSAMNGIYGEIVDGGYGLTYFKSMSAFCSVRCTPCPANYYCPGNSPASPCPPNSRSENGSKTIAGCVCGDGFLDVGGVCFCPVGTFLPSGSGKCSNCPVDSTCAGDNLAVPCPAHSFLPKEVGGLRCVCSSGYYSHNSTGECLECLSGSFCSNGTMTPCWDHSYSLNASSTCTCDDGYHSVPGSGSKCDPCPVGAYCNSGNPPILCSPGSFSDTLGASQCTSCPQNSGSSVPGGNSVQSCVCVPGFAMIGSSSSCFACAPGLYCPGYNNTSMLPCGPGTFQTGHGITDVSGCTQCGAGTFSINSQASSSSVCRPCTLGSFQTGLGTTASSGCQMCPIGTYGSTTGLSSCTPCGAGTVQITTGVTTSTQCTGCLSGTYQTGDGMGLLADCKQCPTGTFQTGTGMPSSLACILCRAGTYQSNVGQPFEAACTSCRAGKFQSMLGAQGPWACESCVQGTYQSMVGSAQNCTPCGKGTYHTGIGAQSKTSCTPCGLGSFQPFAGAISVTACRNCSLGTYQTGTGMGDAETCVSCPRGTFQSASGASSSAMCFMCPAGTYQPWLQATALSDCMACGPGKYQPDIGADLETRCLLCPAGTYQTTSAARTQSQCILCVAGKYLTGSGASRAKDCTSCSVGTYQTTTGATSGAGCILCGPGTYQSSMAARSPLNCTTCPVGTFQTGYGMFRVAECVLCGPGAYSSGLGMGGTKEEVCGQCSAGTYQPDGEVGASACTKCEAGRYQTSEGAAICSLCREGTFQPFTGAHYDGWCTPCDQGTYSSSPGASSLEHCKVCEAGWYTGVSGSTVCQACDTGTYSPISRGTMCFSCMSGTYSNQSGLSVCLKCPVGQSVSGTGETTCVQCGQGQYQYRQGGSSCYPCSPGTFQPNDGSSVCLECSPGQYQSLFNQSTCFLCAPGTHVAVHAATSCLACPAGWFQSDSNSTSCIPCAQGYFQDLTQQIGCIPCMAGYYVDVSGATSCVSCKPGEFQDEGAMSACVKCDEGSYHNRVASASINDCMNCTAGSFSGLLGATTCHVCPSGTFSSEDGITACSLCWPGFFQEVPQATTCQECTAGTFSTAWGVISQETGCVLCPAGMYSSVLSATACSQCPEGESSDIAGAANCSSCAAGTYMAEKGWAGKVCVQCPSGTFSTLMGATSSDTCTLCDNGYFSSSQGQSSEASCLICNSGTVSVPNKTTCRVCGDMEFCPAGYHVPIQCVPGLLCNGTHMESATGFLAVLQGNCTGVVPCPLGTQCALLDADLGKGILRSSPNRTHFVLYQGGNLSIDLSCPGHTLEYGYARVDWPFTMSPVFSPSDVLYWLQPLPCPAGMYLLGETCMPCPAGTFSSQANSLELDACIPCPAGSFGALTGLTMCSTCHVGEYSAQMQSTVCQECSPGFYQPSYGSTGCLPCPTGTFSTQFRSGFCPLCDAGTFQSGRGATECDVCAQSEFSSPGDSACSRCGRSPDALDASFSCSPPVLPDKRHTSIWISMKGGADSDACISTGPSLKQLSANEIAVSHTILRPRTVCVSTLYIASRPELSRSWTNAVGQLLRPIALRVIAYNTTFYPELCKTQGFGVLFTVSDQNGDLLTDLSNVNVVMSLFDPSGQNVLFSMGCSRLPQDPNANIPLGVCRTSFCPTMKVIVKVSLTWTGMQIPPIQGQAVLTPGPVGICQPSSSWSAAVDLQAPSIPYLPGETFDIIVSSINPPSGATLVVFRFALQILGGVSLVSFKSPFSVVTEAVGDVLSVVGDCSQAGGGVLGILQLRLDVAASGVILVARVLPASFQFTLANAVPYTMPVRTLGFSCRADGFVDLLADFPRTTTLITNTKSNYVINWKKIQSNALDFPTAIYTVSVSNVMHSFSTVMATCISLDNRNLVIPSCGIIRAGNTGNVSAIVRVQYQDVSLEVPIHVWVPVNVTFGTITSSGGMSGRYRITAVLSAGSNIIKNVDATPYFPNLRAFGASLAQEQWKCSKPGSSFTIGAPSMYAGVCGNSSGMKSLQPGAVSFFMVSGPKPGLTGIGSYVFPPAMISTLLPSGGFLVFSVATGLSLGIGRISSPSPLSQLTVSSDGYPSVVLRNTGGTARCMPVRIEPSLTEGWQAFTGLIPVFPAGPVELQITLSAYVIVLQQETSTFIPTSTFVVRATLLFSDGTQLSVQSDTRLRMSSTTLQVTGLGAVSLDDHVGDSSLDFTFTGIPCVSTSVSVKVLPSSVREALLICPSCPQFLASDTDPLSRNFPTLFPSSISVSAIVVRRVLFDERIVDRVEPVTVAGGPLVLSDGALVGKGGGSAVILSLTTPSALPLTIQVLHRWVSSWELQCNNAPCTTGLKLAPVLDGASEPPFSYATVLSLSVLLSLHNGSTVLYPWLPDVTFTINQTAVVGPSLSMDSLVFGEMLVQCVFGSAWDMPVLEISNGHLLRVDQMKDLSLHGPSMISQIHCSGLWEEAHVTTTATLTDGSVSGVTPSYSSTSPLVIHHSSGLFHAESGGLGHIIARFGGQETRLSVLATDSSKYFTSVSLESIPSFWNSPIGLPFELSPVLTPVLFGEPWFDVTQFYSRIVSWVSSAPDVISVSSDMTSITLLSDSCYAVTLNASLIACGEDSVPILASKAVEVNVMPSQVGEFDLGNETGKPLPPVAIGHILSIPIFLFTASMRLQSYMVEIVLPESGVRPVGCTSGVLPSSQCALIESHHQTNNNRYVFRSVGAFIQSQLMGRLLVATVQIQVFLNTLVPVQVKLLQASVGHDESIPPKVTTFIIELGSRQTSLLFPPYSLATTVEPYDVEGTMPPSGRVHGDTDGDGHFSTLDVLFMEKYMALAVYGGGQMICTERDTICQSTSRLTVWQLLQLKPVRHPAMPASRPDGSDVLFLLRALVGKAFFLVSLDVKSIPGSLGITIGLSDYAQTMNPPNAVVRLEITTTANQNLAFDSPFQYNAAKALLSVVCKRGLGGYTAHTLPASSTFDEPTVGLRIRIQALDQLGSDISSTAEDRGFVFKPVGSLTVFNIMAPNSVFVETSVVEYLPTIICQTLCDDASLFLDQVMGLPEWINNTALTVRFLGTSPPAFRGFWPFSTNVNAEGTSIMTTTVPLDNKAVFSGDLFNVTFKYTSSLGRKMSLFAVEVSPPLPLVNVYSAEYWAGGPPVFFVTSLISEVQLEFRMLEEGDHVISILELESFPASSSTAEVTRQTWVGIQPGITKLYVTPLCVSGVVLWSKLVPSVQDEPCVVTVVPFWQPGGEKGVPESYTCTLYPCILQGFGQVIRPVIKTYVPSNPRIRIQKSLLSVGQRTQWRAECMLDDKSSSLDGATVVTVTKRALAAGLIRVRPFNALVVTDDSIRSIKTGWATISFGGLVKAGLNTTQTVDPPRELRGLAFSSIGFSVPQGGGVLVAAFSSSPLVAGQRGFLLLQALYHGGYTLLLDPTPAGTDGISVQNASQDIVVSQIDGSFHVRSGAVGGENIPIVEVTFQGIRLVVSATVLGLVPARLFACCSPKVASLASVLSGHRDFPNYFFLEDVLVHFSGHDVNGLHPLGLKLTDARIRLIYDQSLLIFSKVTGKWSLASNAPSTGVSIIVIEYTHPGSLVTLETELSVFFVDADRLDITLTSGPPPLLLHRIHCSLSAFESVSVQGFLNLVSTPELSAVSLDVTDLMMLGSSDNAVVSVVQEPLHQVTVQGVGVGSAEITATVGRLSSVVSVQVLDESVVFQSLISPLGYELYGIKDITAIPLSLNGTLEHSSSMFTNLWGIFGSDIQVSITGSSDLVTVLPSTGSLILHRNPPWSTSLSVQVSLPLCPPSNTVQLVAVTPLTTHLIADTTNALRKGSVFADVDIMFTSQDVFTVALVSVGPVLAFYIQLQTDAGSPLHCVPREDIPLFSDCSTDYPSVGGLVVAGSRSTPFQSPSKTVLVDVHGVNVQTIWGYVEVYDGITARRFSIQAGEYGNTASTGSSNHSVGHMMPALPTVDSSVLSKVFRGLFSVPRTQTVKDAFFNLLVLVGRQRHVDARIYSNEFELSAMFHVTDRFLQPDVNGTGIRVLFHTDKLPSLPGSVLVPGVGMWVNAVHVLDGWYVVEFRQKIPELHLAVSFEVSTTTSQFPWFWDVWGMVDTGLPLPQCPRSAANTASFVASYKIMLPLDINSTDNVILQGLADQVACSVQVASRRVLATYTNANTITLSVALESLARVHQTNLVLLSGWLSKEMDRRVGMLKPLLPTDNVSVSQVDRGDIHYINDTSDPPTPCPYGYYFSRNGTYLELPPHAVAGLDCYEMFCQEGYTFVVETARCIPTPVSTDVVWICVIVILSAVISLAALLCCVQLAHWKTAVDVGDVVFDPATSHGDSQPPDWIDKPPPSNEEIPFEDSDDKETYFQNIVTGAGMDDYSAMMLDTPDDFQSPFSVRSYQ